MSQGEVEQGRRYAEPDFNQIITIKERERYRVQVFMEMIDPREKTLVFCANQEHALAVRDLVNQLKASPDTNYCVRVTADDGAEGERFLRRFQDNEKTIPTIFTTSQKLSSGVDARNIRNIVLMRPVNSMIEFKQIIGRGTRLFEGKDYFTILDFVRAYEHFNDPEWDGEPVAPEPCAACGNFPCTCEQAPPEPCPACGEVSCQCDGEDDGEGEGERPVVEIELAPGKYRQLQHMSATTFWSPDGKPMSATDFIRQLFGELPALFHDEETLRELWSRPDTRQGLLDALAEKGYGSEQLREIGRLVDAENSDLFDVLAYIAFALPPLSRKERVASQRERLFSDYDYRQREFLGFVLDHYIQDGVGELAQDKLPRLIELKYQTPTDAIAELGSVENIREVFIGFQARLYESA